MVNIQVKTVWSTFLVIQIVAPDNSDHTVSSNRSRLTEQKPRTHARKFVTLSPPSSLQQIPKLGNTSYFLPWALNSWFIISKSISVQTLPYLRLVDDVILRSFCSVHEAMVGFKACPSCKDQGVVMKFCPPLVSFLHCMVLRTVNTKLMCKKTSLTWVKLPLAIHLIALKMAAKSFSPRYICPSRRCLGLAYLTSHS